MCMVMVSPSDSVEDIPPLPNHNKKKQQGVGFHYRMYPGMT